MQHVLDTLKQALYRLAKASSMGFEIVSYSKTETPLETSFRGVKQIFDRRRD